MLQLPLTREEEPEILELLHARPARSLHRHGESKLSLCSREPMSSYLEVLILIPAASHSATNQNQSHIGSPDSMKPTRQHHPRNSRDVILWFPNLTLFGLWLHLDILSMEIMNRTGDKRQPCRIFAALANTLLSVFTKCSG